MRYVSSIPLVLVAGCVISQPIPGPAAAAERQKEEVVEAVEVETRPVEAEAAETPRWPMQEIGRSIRDRPILMTTVGTGPRRVIWIGGIHGDEQEGYLAAERLPADLESHSGGLDQVTLYIVHSINPDGKAMRRRGNANGVDLNRNFPAQNFNSRDPRFGGEPLSQPEAEALGELIAEVEPDLVVVSHAWRGDHFINYDGPAEQLAILFTTLSGYRVQSSEGIAPTPGSLGSWVGVDMQIPILTLEYERGTDPEEAWKQTRLALLAVILGD